MYWHCKKREKLNHPDDQTCTACGHAMIETAVSVQSPLATQEGGDHYRSMKIQPIEYIHANGIPFAEGCIVKYVSRWRAKGGIGDLRKARHVIDLLIELEAKANQKAV